MPNLNIVSSSWDGTIKIWLYSNTSYYSSYYILVENLSDFYESLAILPNTNIVSAATFGKTIIIWQSEYPFKSIATLKGHTSYVWALAILPNLNIVSGSEDTTIKIWNSTSYQLIITLAGHINSVRSLAILSNSNIVSGSWDTTIKIWQSISPFNLIATLTGHTNTVSVLKILSNSNLVSASYDSTIKIWTLKKALLTWLILVFGSKKSVHKR